jgi:hypothetical protein
VTRPGRALSAQAYDTACDLAGAALLRRVPAAATLLQVTEEKVWLEFLTAVYIAADSNNAVRYGGSAVRSGRSSAGDRIQEHVRAGRAARWIRLMVVPLGPGTEARLVRRIEGRVGAVLRPVDTMRLPNFRRKSSGKVVGFARRNGRWPPPMAWWMFPLLAPFARMAECRVPRPKPPTTPAAPTPPKPRRVTTWIMADPDKLRADDQARLTAICQRCPALQTLANHVRDFAAMMRNLTGGDLTQWMTKVLADDLPGLHSFVKAYNATWPP